MRFSFPAYAALPDGWEFFADNPDVGFMLMYDLDKPGSLPRPLLAMIGAQITNVIVIGLRGAAYHRPRIQVRPQRQPSE